MDSNCREPVSFPNSLPAGNSLVRSSEFALFDQGVSGGVATTHPVACSANTRATQFNMPLSRVESLGSRRHADEVITVMAQYGIEAPPNGFATPR